MLNSRVIIEGIYGFLSFGDFSKWTGFVINEKYYLKKCEEFGQFMVDIREQHNAFLVDKGKVIEIEGLKVFIVNTTDDISSLGEYICNLVDNNGEYMCDYAFMWNHNIAENKYFVTLRSHNENNIDVSIIAKKFTNNNNKIKHEPNNKY